MSAMLTRLLVVIVGLGAMARAGHAQPAGAQAEVLFREGRQLMTQGKVAEACAAFEQSQKLEAAVTTLLNLAGCREKNGQLATAWGLFLDVARETRGGDDAARQLHDIAQDRAKKLEARVSKLTINVAAEVDGLDVTRGTDKVASAMWNRALPVDGGAYTITARAPGMTSWSTQVTIKPEGDTKTVDIPKLTSTSAHPVVTPVTKPVVTAPPPVTKPVVVVATPPVAKPVTPPPVTKPVTPPLVTKPVTPPPPNKPVVVASPPAKPPVTKPPPLMVSSALDKPDDSSSGPTDRSEHPSTFRRYTLPIAVGAGALVLGGVALGFDLSSSSTYNQYKAQRSNNSLYDSANNKYKLAQGFGVAALLGAGAAVWLFVRASHGSDEPTHASLFVSPTGIGLAGGF